MDGMCVGLDAKVFTYPTNNAYCSRFVALFHSLASEDFVNISFPKYEAFGQIMVNFRYIIVSIKRMKRLFQRARYCLLLFFSFNPLLLSFWFYISFRLYYIPIKSYIKRHCYFLSLECQRLGPCSHKPILNFEPCQRPVKPQKCVFSNC